MPITMPNDDAPQPDSTPEPSTDPTDTRPTLSAVLLGVAASATVVNLFFVGSILLYAFTKSGGRRGPGDMGPLGFFLPAFAAVAAATVLGSITSFAGLKVERRPGRRRWFKALYCFHTVIVALGVAYMVFCSIY